jgi:hypothetical protein
LEWRSTRDEQSLVIVDAINFGGEIDMLLGRLNHHNEYVDLFVISECDKTYTGNFKGFQFIEHKDLFKQFRDKILYNQNYHLGDSHAWTNEHHQRRHMNQILQELRLSDNDVVFYFDTDEWIDFDGLDALTAPTAFNMKKFLFSVHWYQKHELTGFAAPYSYIRKKDINAMRWARNSYPIIDNGWHWTSLGTLDYHLQKLRGFSHTELLTHGWELRATRSWKEGIDFLTNEHYQELEIADNYPDWIKDKKAPKTWYRKRKSTL